LPRRPIGFDEGTLEHNGGTFGACGTVRLKARLARREKQAGVKVLVNAGCQGYSEDSRGTFVAIARVDGDDHHRSSAFVGWFSVHPDEPDFTTNGRTGA